MKKNDVIASVCKVMSSEREALGEQKSREEWAQTTEAIRRDVNASDYVSKEMSDEEQTSDIDDQLVDFDVNDVEEESEN